MIGKNEYPPDLIVDLLPCEGSKGKVREKNERNERKIKLFLRFDFESTNRLSSLRDI